MSDQQLNRLLRRLGLLLVVGVIAFVGFYVLDRWKLPQPTIVNREMAALEEAVRADPNDIASRGQLADLYAGVGRNDDAIGQYTVILDTGKADKPAYLGRAKAYQATGQLDLAAADYQQVVDMARDAEMAVVDRQLQAAYYGLGAIALEQDRPGDAVEHLTAALKINRADADALYLLGRAHTANGQPAEGIAALKRAVAFVPVGWPEPFLALAEAYRSAGDTDRAAWAEAMATFAGGDAVAAKAALEPLAGGSAGLEAAVGLGLIAETEGDTGAAAAWYAQALQLDPENDEARLGLTRVAAPEPAATPLPELPKPGELGG